MKSIIKYIVFLLFIVNVPACNNSKKEEIILNTLSRLSPHSDFNKRTIVLIIPFDGCASCFEEATNLVPDVLNYSGIVIVTNLLKKRIYNYLDDIGVKKDSVIIDTLQLSITNKLIDINPKIFVIENRSVIYSKIVSVQSIDEISKYIFNKHR